MRVYKHSRLGGPISLNVHVAAALSAAVGMFLLIADLAERQAVERLAIELALLLPAIFLSARSHVNRSG